MPSPAFYFAVGARPRPRDCLVALLAGQHHFLVPAGSTADRLLQRTPDVHVVLDSWAFPPGNPVRPSLARYAHLVAGWHARTRCTAEAGQLAAPWLDWAATYDTIGDSAASERDDAQLQALCRQLCRTPDPPIVPVIHYPAADADAMIGDLLRDRALCFDDDEQTQLDQRLAWGFADAPDSPSDWPMCAIGGLVPAHYSRDSACWYERLIADLEAAVTLDPFQRRIHLLGVGRPSWVLASPLVMSFDSSGPARLALIGFDQGIGRAYTDAYGLSIAKLRRSREARLVYHVADYRARVGLPWQRVDAEALLDDRELALIPAADLEHWDQVALA